MIHVGDITKLNGAAIEPVWCITGGSPCQDLSIAGKRAGLAGARSGLYMEQIRIVKEMRARDERNGRPNEFVRPRYMVWENVPGAFSSNSGDDFRAVLEELARIAEPDAVIPRPPKGRWRKAGAILGDGWSIAWRTHDAQYWGVPQRRRRIALVADFGGITAAEILFERESLSGDIAAGGSTGERPTGGAEAGFDPAVGDCMTAWDCQSKRIFDTNGKSPTLQGGIGGGVNNPAIFCLATQQGGVELRTDDRMLVCEAIPDVAHTLRAKANCAYREDAETYPVQNTVVRRLTPLECTRLQGYPDGWVDIGDWTDEKGKKHKDADSPKYKALGNSIALPFWDWMLRRMAQYLPEHATLGSLFDGIGGFPLCWEKIHGDYTARWASEIEEFPMAVTKKHFPEKDEAEQWGRNDE